MSNMYNTGIEDLGTGVVIWGTTDVRCTLLTSSYTFDADHDYYDDVNTYEISQGGAGTLSGMTTSVDTGNDEVTFDAADELYSSLSAGETPSQIVIWKYNATPANAELICRNVLTPTVPAPNGGDYTIVWDSEGVFEISN